MKIGAIEKFSMVDYPGKLCAILFTQGCNFRCPYCHNPELVDAKKFTTPLSEDEILSFLQSRKNKLDAVVITGGEPTLHNDLPEFISKIKKMGFLIKLDTNGSNPEMIQKLIKMNLINYFAMDIKSNIADYDITCGTSINKNNILKSISLIRDSGVEYEFRTTIVAGVHEINNILQINELLQDKDKYFIQNFVGEKTLSQNTNLNAFSHQECTLITNNFSEKVTVFRIR